MMPPKGNEARAAAMAELDALMHRLRTEPRLADWLRARRAGAARRRRSAPTCARCGATGARPTRCPQSLVEAQTLASVALRARLAHAAAGQRLGAASSRTSARWCGSRARRRSCSPTQTGLAPLRRADGPLRAGHDAARRSTACSANVQAVAAGADRARAGEAGAARRVIAPPGRSRSRRSAR